MTKLNDGGSAFPLETSTALSYPGMSLRDYFAAHAPVDYRAALFVFGADLPRDDKGRAAFFAVWSLLRYEYADAMIEQRNKEST